MLQFLCKMLGGLPEPEPEVEPVRQVRRCEHSASEVADSIDADLRRLEEELFRQYESEDTYEAAKRIEDELMLKLNWLISHRVAYRWPLVLEDINPWVTARAYGDRIDLDYNAGYKSLLRRLKQIDEE